MSTKKTLILVAGPTAVGKTSIAIQLAEHFNTGIISADSRQIFKELTIGTAKPSPSELARVRHYFIGSHSIHDPYDAATYGDEAFALINELFVNSDKVVMCGGSGLYIKAVVDGFDEIPEVPEEVRDEIMEQYDQNGIGWLHEKMEQLDPGYLKVVDIKNPHRLIRALEVRMYTGESITTFRKNQKRDRHFEIAWIGLELPREELYERIDSRMDKMITDGLFEEAQALYPFRHHNALQTVGYQEIFEFMQNHYDMEECIRLLKRNSRRYAKRQLTWFKKNHEFTWFHPGDVQKMIMHIAGLS